MRPAPGAIHGGRSRRRDRAAPRWHWRAGSSRGRKPIRSREDGSAVVEFALVAPLAVMVALAVAQFALFLFERNVVMGSLSEGARVAAASGRTVADGERAARNLLREALGGRIALIVQVHGAVESGLVVLRADATLPSLVPGVPGLEVHMTATMHKEEDLGAPDETQVMPGASRLMSGGETLAANSEAVGPDSAAVARDRAAVGPDSAAVAADGAAVGKPGGDGAGRGGKAAGPRKHEVGG